MRNEGYVQVNYRFIRKDSFHSTRVEVTLLEKSVKFSIFFFEKGHLYAQNIGLLDQGFCVFSENFREFLLLFDSYFYV